MGAPAGIVIESIGEAECDEFFGYLNDHRSDNGAGGEGYFLPLSRSESGFPSDKAQAFRDGLRLPVGVPGWRRAWAARLPSRQVVGHVDLRSHPVRFAEHRCLLGMGVDRNHRRRGLGTALLAHASAWTLANTRIEWVDLEVLSTNKPAVRLYLRSGFAAVGDVPEMFKLDGRLIGRTLMTKRLQPASNGAG